LEVYKHQDKNNTPQKPIAKAIG